MGDILIAEANETEASTLRRSLEAAGVEHPVRTTAGAVTGPDGLGAGIDVLSVFIASNVGAAELDACPDLRLITTRSTGFDHVDVAACMERGVTVVNVPTYGENTVAEHAFALILSLSRNVHKAWVRTRRNDFSLDGLQGFDLRGRTLGVVGTGHIGLHVAKIARGFGMRVIAFDVTPHSLLAEVIGFDYVGLDELVASSDIVTLHAPLTPATHHLVDQGLLSKFKPGSLLINTARGGLVDTQALIWALDAGILRGAGLDVLESEHALTEDQRMLMRETDPDRLRALLGNRLLVEREDVVVTPHIAFDSVEAVQRIIDVTAKNIVTFLAGAPQNVVSR